MVSTWDVELLFPSLILVTDIPAVEDEAKGAIMSVIKWLINKYRNGQQIMYIELTEYQ